MLSNRRVRIFSSSREEMNDLCTFSPARPNLFQLRCKRDSSALISSSSSRMICSRLCDMHLPLQLTRHEVTAMDVQLLSSEGEEGVMNLILIILILLILVGGGGGYYYGGPSVGGGIGGLLVLILILWLFFGNRP